MKKRPAKAHPWRKEGSKEVAKRNAEKQRRDARRGKHRRTHSALERVFNHNPDREQSR